MFKKRFLWLMIIAAFMLCTSSLYAQMAAGPEKVMIFNGEKLKVQLDGEIRLNMVQNQFNVVNDTYQLWVNNQKFGIGLVSYPFPSVKGSESLWFPYQGNLTRGSLIFDVRQSKLGLTIQGPGLLGGTSFGRFEVDFYGGVGASSGNVIRQPVIRMRNAYAGLAWDTEMFGFKLTFGQYTSLMTPVLAYPVSVAFFPWFDKGVLFDWDQGIMVSFRIGTPKVNLLIDADITRAKAGDDTAGTLYPGISGPVASVDERGNGEATMHPAWHGRVAVNVKPVDIFGFTVAVTGHYYEERTTLPFTNLAGYGINFPTFLYKTDDVPSKSLGLQAKLSVWIFLLQGAGWMGENMDNFTAMFGTGYRQSLSGLKNLADKGRGGYCQLAIIGPKVGIPIMLFVGMGQELKNHNPRIPNTSASGSILAPAFPTIATYALSTLGGATAGAASVVANSEVSGGLWVFLGPNMKIGYEVGQMVTKFKGTAGTSTNMLHRLALSYTF